MTDLAEAPLETAPDPTPSGLGAAIRLIAIVAVAVGLFVAFGLALATLPAAPGSAPNCCPAPSGGGALPPAAPPRPPTRDLNHSMLAHPLLLRLHGGAGEVLGCRHSTPLLKEALRAQRGPHLWCRGGCVWSSRLLANN